MRVLIIIAALLAQMAVYGQSPDVSRIKALMEQQTKAWNQGDLEAFMATYWKSDSLLFIGKTGVNYGWQKTLDNYKKSYPDKTAMGQLNFNLLEFRKLAPDAYFVVGKWHLTRTIGDLSGHFTLIIRMISGEWKIVADHSS